MLLIVLYFRLLYEVKLILLIRLITDAIPLNCTSTSIESPKNAQTVTFPFIGIDRIFREFNMCCDFIRL